MKKDDVIHVTITDMTEDGEGVGKVSGCAFFVSDTVIGDEVEAVVTSMKKNYGFAKVSRRIVSSPYRITAPCQKAHLCGGCQLQEMDYEAQLCFKQEKVQQNLSHIGGLSVPVEPVIGMENPFRYRNKTEISFVKSEDGKVTAGFCAGRSHKVVPQTDCLLSPAEDATIIRTVTDFMEDYGIEPYSFRTGKGLVRQLLIRHAFATGQTMAVFVVNGNLPASAEFSDRLCKIPGMTFVGLSENTQKTGPILGKTMIPLYGSGKITEQISDIFFEISPRSFFQVNPVQTEKLVQIVTDFAVLSGDETVCDLYCGIGTLSLFLAKRAKRVIGVEVIPDAIEDAKQNAQRNGIGNVQFLCGKAEEIVPGLISEKSPDKECADVMVVDPPRKGCDERLLHVMAKAAPKRIVYVSCHPATLARDLKILTADGYTVSKVQPVDMFPMTGHIETVVQLIPAG